MAASLLCGCAAGAGTQTGAEPNSTAEAVGPESGSTSAEASAEQMSREVRAFVDAVTGWQTNTMVCFELSRLNQPELAELVRYYYEPEFAYYSEADAKLAIERGKELIRKWA